MKFSFEITGDARPKNIIAWRSDANLHLKLRAVWTSGDLYPDISWHQQPLLMTV